jgi:hypothetical protein
MNMTIYEYKSRCEWLAKFYAEAAETGREMQFHNGDWVDYERGPNMESIPDKWRIKPEPQDKGFDANSEANAHLIDAAPDLLEALKALMTNPHVNLGDLIYKVRDSEGEGWDGPQVKAWSDAVQAATAAIAKAEGRGA